MFNYIFPIFAFGLVITGIVFLGLQQASDMAREASLQRLEAEKKDKRLESVSQEATAVSPKQ